MRPINMSVAALMVAATEAAAQGSLLGGGDRARCPKSASISTSTTSSSPSTMSEAQAAAFLAQVKHDALAKESTSGAAALTASLTRAAQKNGTNALALGLFVNNYPNAAVAAFADLATQTQHAVARVRADAWSNLGATLDATGRYTDAIRAFSEAIALGGRRYSAVAGLGVAMANAGDLKGAEPLLREATTINGKRGSAFTSLANVLSCEGKTTMAFAALRSAQSGDFVDDVQNTLDQQAKKSGSGGDDASAPLPEPPGPSATSNGYGRSQPGPQIATPKVASSVKAYLEQAPQLLALSLSYQNEAMTHMQKTNDYDGSDDGPSHPTSSGLVFTSRYANDVAAKRATSIILDRTQPKLDLAITEFGDAMQNLQKLASDRSVRDNDADARCQNAAKTESDAEKCKRQRCNAINALGSELHSQWLGAFNLLASGVAGASAKYDKAMRAWIDYATSPGVQYALDQERRAQLMNFQATLYAQARDGYAQSCDDAGGGNGSATADDDPGDKPGPCKKVELELKGIASLEADCHEMTFSPDIDLPVDLGLTIKIRRATGNAPGSLYISLGSDVDVPLVAKESVDAGFAMSWNADGLVTKSGFMAQTTLTVDKDFATAAQQLMGSKQSTTSLSLEAGYNIVNQTAFAGAYGS